MTNQTTKFTLSEQLEEAIAQLDFWKIHTAMQALNWKWGQVNGDFAIPTPDLMNTCIRRLAQTVDESVKVQPTKTSWASSGGFNVTWFGEEQTLEVSFRVDDFRFEDPES